MATWDDSDEEEGNLALIAQIEAPSADLESDSESFKKVDLIAYSEDSQDSTTSSEASQGTDSNLESEQ
ncbi:hypothetical protein A2U01_0026553, partial [Trifolium medium]|nr:hypothetical protein [Trifolium medium]